MAGKQNFVLFVVPPGALLFIIRLTCLSPKMLLPGGLLLHAPNPLYHFRTLEKLPPLSPKLSSVAIRKIWIWT
jgi:hypothetical protein